MTNRDTLDKRKHDKLIFFLPVIVLLFGIIICLILYYVDDEKMISVIYWLYEDFKHIIYGGQLSDIKFPESSNIIGIRILCWLWIAGFIASLFIVSKKLHTGTHFVSSDSFLKKREPYLMVANLNKLLKQINMQTNCKELESLIYRTKNIEEELAIESDFGSGGQDIIDCENEIAKQLKTFSNIVNNINSDNLNKSIGLLNIVLIEISSLLQQRMDLKRK